MVTWSHQAPSILLIYCTFLYLRKVSLTLFHSVHIHCVIIVSISFLFLMSLTIQIPRLFRNFYFLIPPRINCSLLPLLRWTDVQSVRLLIVPMKRWSCRSCFYTSLVSFSRRRVSQKQHVPTPYNKINFVVVCFIRKDSIQQCFFLILEKFGERIITFKAVTFAVL